MIFKLFGHSSNSRGNSSPHFLPLHMLHYLIVLWYKKKKKKERKKIGTIQKLMLTSAVALLQNSWRNKYWFNRKQTLRWFTRQTIFKHSVSADIFKNRNIKNPPLCMIQSWICPSTDIDAKINLCFAWYSIPTWLYTNVWICVDA